MNSLHPTEHIYAGTPAFWNQVLQAFGILKLQINNVRHIVSWVPTYGIPYYIAYIVLGALLSAVIGTGDSIMVYMFEFDGNHKEKMTRILPEVVARHVTQSEVELWKQFAVTPADALFALNIVPGSLVCCLFI